MNEKQYKRRGFLIDVFYFAVILAIIYVILKYLINLVMPFFLAFVFAGISRPVAKFLSRTEKRVKNPDGIETLVPRKFSMNSKLSGIISVLVLFVIIAGIVALVIARVIDTGADLVARAPAIYYDRVLPVFEDFIARQEAKEGVIDSEVWEMILSAAPQLLTTIGGKITEWSASLVVWITSLAASLPNLLLNTIICLIATVFIAIDFNDICEFLKINLPDRTLRVATLLKDSFLDTVGKFVKSYFFIFLITCSEVLVGMLLVRQSRPVLIAVLIAIFDAFPIVGSGMILLPWAILTLISGQTAKGIGLLIIYAVVVVARQFLEPKIVGKHVGMRPIATLVCMYVGTSLFGGIGLFGLPIMAAILVDVNQSGEIPLFTRISREGEEPPAPVEEPPKPEYEDSGMPE